ncbi:zf-HC2 domain-containing protein [bacterium]|nr:zf-HC2 domain-containing protein [bacterium]
MKLTCAQMDVLISFYLEGDLSSALKNQVEHHLKICPTCQAKFEIIKSMISDLKNSFEDNSKPAKQEAYTNDATSQHYRVFKNNLSAYIDNELPSEENIKIKKFTINNPKARQDLEDNYNIRRLLNESFKKTKSETRQDFSKNILKQLELDDYDSFGIHPAIKLLIIFTFAVLVITSFVLMSLSV